VGSGEDRNRVCSGREKEGVIRGLLGEGGEEGGEGGGGGREEGNIVKDGVFCSRIS